MARAGTRHLAAILFTDIVDSTAVASRLGDARWRALIARHHEVVRRALKRFGGTELDTAGDGFFASFREPAAAIRCACRISEEVRRLGVEVRAGVHFGECERAGGKLAGLAVVVGARVMALGGAGDVMVTGSTGELVAGSGISFEPRGEHALKGVDGTWRVGAVTALDGVPKPGPATPEEARQRLAAIEPTTAPSRARWLLVGGVAAALVVALVVVLLVRSGSDDGPREAIDLPTNAAARLTADGALQQVVTLDERPGASAVGFGSLWVAWPDRGRVARLSLEDGAVTDTIQVGTNPSGLAVTDDAVWVTNSSDGTIGRIDPETNEVSQTWDAGTSPTALTAGGEFLWVADSIGSRLLRIDPTTGKATTIPLTGEPSAVEFTPDGVWVSIAPSSVARVDPETAEVTFTKEVGNGPAAVLAAYGSIWVANHLDGTISRLDPLTGTEGAKISVGEGPGALVEADGRVWVASEFDDAIQAIDPATNTVSLDIPVGASAASLDADGDALWLMAGASEDEHRGGTLQIASAQRFSSLDPSASDDVSFYAVFAVTHDGLVAFRKTGGPGGTTIVADLARSLPQVSDDGLTYRFALREGIRFSTGEEVVPEDFVHSMERTASLNEYAADLFGAIGGTKHCHLEPATCDLSSAIRTDGSEITIVLTRRDPDLLRKLALPFASVLPASTPMRRQAGTDLATTGPYLIDGADRNGITLVRNPEFTEWSAAAQPDGYADTISWTFETDLTATYDRLLAGDLDLMREALAQEDYDSLLAEHPDQIVVAPLSGTLFIGFDVMLAPFDDRRVRRAVNFAIDRHRTADLLGGPSANRLTCQILPPTLPGYEATCPYTRDPRAGVWSAPDLDRARSLIDAAGARGARVRLFVPRRGQHEEWNAAMLDVGRLLESLGLRVIRESVPGEMSAYFGALYDTSPGSRAHPQVFFSGWFADFPSPSYFLETQFRCDAETNAAGYCDPALDARMDAAKALESTDPGAATRAWTSIEATLLRDAVQAPLVNQVATYPVSARADNVQVHPQWGPLLSLMWVQ
jgi:peptide/nickel transport system substrate-binding protein